MRCGCFGTATVERKSSAAAGSYPGVDGELLQDINHFSYSELRLATDNFHTSNKIRRGGFGTVSKGLKRGKEIAVKTLSAYSKQGVREFLNEIKTISKVRHQNLVELIGCCAEGSNRILVYEYVENNNLDLALFQVVQTSNWTGGKDRLFAWVLLEVLLSFMKNLCHPLCIETSKLVIYFWTKISTPKLEILGWLNSFQITSLTLAQE